jgi:hypothetical protein
MLGCWRGVQSVRYYGGLPRAWHILGVEDSISMLITAGDGGAYSISGQELEAIASEIA